MPPETPLDATVVICTRNRAASLQRTLATVARAGRHVTRPWELVVVDNGSTDDTRAVAESFAGTLPVRVVAQPVPGLSNARNAGLAAARGRHIVWTDDDVAVDAGWLAAYLAAFDAHPECAVFGGTAVPRYEPPARTWFVAAERSMGSLLALRNATAWDEITPDRIPFGLNYAVRAAEQRRFPYDPALGVAPGRRGGGEETAMIRALLAAGGRGRWVWDARVEHLIPVERQRARYVFTYYRAFGRAFPADVGTGRRALPAAALRLARKGTAALVRRAAGSPAWVPSFIDFARAVGTVDRLRETRR